MTAKGEIAKDKIIKVTTQLIDQEGDVNNISIRRISRLAGVSLSSINYYFHTKDDLIEKSIRIRINRVISRWFELEPMLAVDPVSKYRIYLRNLGEFIAKHPKVMQVSFIIAATHRETDDSLTLSHEKIVFPLLKAICPDKSDLQIKMAMSMTYDSIYMALLSWVNYPDRCACDFSDKGKREKYLDMLTDSTVLVLKSFEKEQ